jgi:hypothetical protein
MGMPAGRMKRSCQSSAATALGLLLGFAPQLVLSIAGG